MAVSQQIIEVIDALCEKFGIVIDWTNQNVIPYLETLCQKCITFEIVTSIFWMCTPLFLAATFLTIALITSKKASNPTYSWDEDEPVVWVAIASWVVLAFIGVWTLVAIPTQTYDIIEAITFPEKTIFDYITNAMQ
jgi:hypothetical protein